MVLLDRYPIQRDCRGHLLFYQPFPLSPSSRQSVSFGLRNCSSSDSRHLDLLGAASQHPGFRGHTARGPSWTCLSISHSWLCHWSVGREHDYRKASHDRSLRSFKQVLGWGSREVGVKRVKSFFLSHGEYICHKLQLPGAGFSASWKNIICSRGQSVNFRPHKQVLKKCDNFFMQLNFFSESLFDQLIESKPQ